MNKFPLILICSLAGLTFATTTAKASCADAWGVYQRSNLSSAYASSDGLSGIAKHKGPTVCTWAKSPNIVWAKQTAIENCNRAAAAKHLGRCTIVAYHM